MSLLTKSIILCGTSPLKVCSRQTFANDIIRHEVPNKSELKQKVSSKLESVQKAVTRQANPFTTRASLPALRARPQLRKLRAVSTGCVNTWRNL